MFLTDFMLLWKHNDSIPYSTLSQTKPLFLHVCSKSLLKLKGCPRTTRWAHVTLTFDLPEQMFQMACLHVIDTVVSN